MKEFNLTEYLKNPSQKVFTRDGREVRIICTDFLSKMNKPVIALIKEDENKESVWNFTKNGKYYLCKNEESLKDLFFASIKREGWVNLYRNNNTTHIGNIYSNEKEAKEYKDEDLYITTIKIKWEE